MESSKKCIIRATKIFILFNIMFIILILISFGTMIYNSFEIQNMTYNNTSTNSNIIVTIDNINYKYAYIGINIGYIIFGLFDIILCSIYIKFYRFTMNTNLNGIVFKTNYKIRICALILRVLFFACITILFINNIIYYFSEWNTRFQKIILFNLFTMILGIFVDMTNLICIKYIKKEIISYYEEF